MNKSQRVILSTAAGLAALAGPLAAHAAPTNPGPVPLGPNASVNLPVGINHQTGQILIPTEHGPTGQDPNPPAPSVYNGNGSQQAPDPGPMSDPSSGD